MNDAALFPDADRNFLLAGGKRGVDPYCDRSRLAGETLDLIRPLMPRFGVTRLARVTGLDNVGIPVWSAIRPNSKTLAQSQGKGLDDDSAAISALMESIEVSIAERDDYPSIRASMTELDRRGQLFHVMDHMRRRGREPAGRDEKLDWMRGVELVSGAPMLAPRETVLLTDGHGRGRYWQTTDGLASGNTPREAIFHGLCERIERDALALWLLRSDDEVRERCVSVDSFSDPALDGLVELIDAAQLQVRLFDLTTDIGIPVFGAFISPPPDGREDQWRHFDLASGYGCHPSPTRAAIRAITEAAQTRVTTISAARDDFDPRVYATRLDPSLTLYARCSAALRPEFAKPAAELAQSELYLERTIGKLVDKGVKTIIAFPLSVGDERFSVVKTLVPELESPHGDRETPYGPRAMAFSEGDA